MKYFENLTALEDVFVNENVSQIDVFFHLAERGVSEAQLELGLLYWKKAPSTRFKNEAIRLFELASKQGNVEAENMLMRISLETNSTKEVPTLTASFIDLLHQPLSMAYNLGSHIIIHTEDDGSYDISFNKVLFPGQTRLYNKRVLVIGYYFWLVITAWVVLGVFASLFVLKEGIGIIGILLLVLSCIRFLRVKKLLNIQRGNDLLNACVEHMEKSDFNGALDDMKAIITKSSPYSLEAYGNLAYLYYLNDIKDKAEETLFKALDMSGGATIPNIKKIR